MADNMRIFHGSRYIVKVPKIKTSGNYKDFGYGFYCTNIERQAKRWALHREPDHIVNVYSYMQNPQLKVQTFKSMTEEWLDFIVDCRSGKTHHYDLVEGPMADDTIWDYVEDYLDGLITREVFWVLVKFKHPTHQIAFCTENALETLSFERSYNL